MFQEVLRRADDYIILSLLPSYLERKGSSLVYMAERLIKESGRAESGFYLYDYERLYNMLKVLAVRKEKVLLTGVTFALLDFGEKHRLEKSKISNLIVMETGGMKGKREELDREELHSRLSTIFGKNKIHSEYGMCELSSQAYSCGDGIFRTPPWVRIVVKEINNRF